MSIIRTCLNFLALLGLLTLTVLLFAIVAGAQTPVTNPDLRPDVRRARAARQPRLFTKSREGAYRPATSQWPKRSEPLDRSRASMANQMNSRAMLATSSILPGTPLWRVLHTGQISLTSSAGTTEQLVDRNSNGSADERVTFDSAGGSFDLAVGVSGARYEVYSASLNNRLVGVLVLALDTNGDYRVDTTSTFDLERDFNLPSAASVATGVAKNGREFVVVSSSGYYNEADPGDPNNEPSPGVVLLVRDPSTGGFDNALSRSLVTVGDNRLYNANALTLLPNNDLLIADFHSNELRIVRDTNADGLPDTLDAQPYYSYRFSDDAPLDIAANSRGVVFSHSEGDDTVLLAIYDQNLDGRGDFDEVVVVGLSLDNNLFLHGLTVDRLGNVYVIEDASGPFDSSNGGYPRVDAFADPSLNGFLRDGTIFYESDAEELALTGLAFGSLPPNPINDARFFVRRHYLDFLNREPEPAGLDYWTGQIQNCGTNFLCLTAVRTGVSAAFFIEQEFQTTGSFVYRLYKGGLGRRPTYLEFVQDRALLDGANLESSKQALALTFVSRAAFQQRYATNNSAESFVDALIASIQQNSNLNVMNQRAAMISRYNAGSNLNQSRSLALREVIESAAFVEAEYNPSFVLMQYFGYLGRDAEQGGFDFWLNVLNNREPNNYRGMVCSFITSREYQERFGLALRRSNADCAQ